MNSQKYLENQLSQWHKLTQSHPNNPNYLVQRGMVNFKLGKINESIDDFDRTEKLDPAIKPYLWQRGLSFYYAYRFVEGAAQFEADLAVNSGDLEESIWRYLCISRSHGKAKAQESLASAKNYVKGDRRLIMQKIYELYTGKCTPDQVIAAGEAEGDRGEFYAYLYLGLYYEAGTETEQNLALAQAYMVKAARDYQLDDYMWYLAIVHGRLRGWLPV